MMTFDLPFSPDAQGAFALSINESPPLRFPSRDAALSYAVRLANQRTAGDVDYAINVEGGDGKWRLFQGSKQLTDS